jgi:putative ABC transport system ATP-binding protein
MNLVNASPSPAISISHMTVEKGQAAIVSDCSANIAQGEKVVLKGPSGSGKSTLLKALMGFEPFKGSVSLLGTPLTASTVKDLRGRMAFVGQSAALGTGTVKTYVQEILQSANNADLPDPWAKMEAYCQRLQLPERIWEQATSALSGGEQQRVLLALAMALNRELYLLDEPTSALDDALQKEVITWLSQESDATILVAAHADSWAAAGWRTLSINNHE